jgi:MFS transporter, AAHS family, 4-hydroxybenzoate transporter
VATSSAAASTLNIDNLIERQKIGGFLLVTLSVGFLTQLIEGFDLTTAGIVGPALAAALNIPRAQMGLVFGVVFLGLLAGGLVLGPLGDLMGRKATTIIATIWYSVLSLATLFVHGLTDLVAVRFLTGMGLGAVLPLTIALMCEYAPQRMRAIVVNIMLCGLSLGGVIGGLGGAELIPLYGWKIMFYIGGFAPLMMVPFLILWFPESARFLVLRGGARNRIASLAKKLDPNLAISPDTRFTIREVRRQGAPVRHLFTRGWAPATILLWITMLLNFILVGFFTQYMPTMLTVYGLGMHDAVRAAGVFQIGALFGTILLGWVVDRRGYFTVLAACYLGAFACAVLMVSFGPATLPITICALASGICISGGQNTVNALSGAFYPTQARSTGSSWAIGIGRIGGSLGLALAGAMLGAQWPVPAIFVTISCAGLAAGATVLVMGRVAARSPAIRELRALEEGEPTLTAHSA